MDIENCRPIGNRVLIKKKENKDKSSLIIPLHIHRETVYPAKIIKVSDKVKDLYPKMEVLVLKNQGVEVAKGFLLIEKSAIKVISNYNENN
jgi:co-chaperonin GroES (HSP10)